MVVFFCGARRLKSIPTVLFVHSLGNDLIHRKPQNTICKEEQTGFADAYVKYYFFRLLVKAGKLTAEEYEIMKTHAEKGGEIIKSTFGNAGDEEYEKIAREGI